MTNPNQWPMQNREAMGRFYGDPDPDHDGVSNRAWEDANLTSIVPPYRMVLAWDTTRTVKSIRCHKKVAGSLESCLAGIVNYYGTQEAVEAARMNLFGGCVAFRLMRGGSQLSVHSWGAAIDLDPQGNPLGVRHREGVGMMPAPVVAIFHAQGWIWGGEFSRQDCQHFQAARI